MKKYETFVGIDYSMNGPACCVYDGKEHKFLALQTSKKEVNKFSTGNGFHFDVRLVEKNYKNNIERYVALSKCFLDFIVKEKSGNTIVGMEGYALGAKGRIFNIAELTQTLKLRLYNSKDIDFHLDSPTPGTVKKLATGKGNSGKILMVESFNEATGVNLLDHSTKKFAEDSPISDIADSYWVMRTIQEMYK